MSGLPGAEERVVEAALAWLRADRAGSEHQVREAEANLRERLEALLEQDAAREKPKWRRPVKTTLGLGGGS